MKRIFIVILVLSGVLSPVFCFSNIAYADTFTLTYNTDGNGYITGDNPQYVEEGNDGTAVEAVPNEGYYFVNWDDLSTDNPRTDTDIDGDITVTANFAIYTYTLTYYSDTNGYISGSDLQYVDYGNDGSQVEAIPIGNYYFANWSDLSTNNPRIDSYVTDNITVTANFAPDFVLTYSSDDNGYIDGATPQYVGYGQDGTAVSAIPNEGYRFFNWSDSSTDNPRTDTVVTGDITVTANFCLDQYTLTYNAGANGNISGDSPQVVDVGNNGSAVEAVPDEGYHFINWDDLSVQNPRTDTDVISDITVTANFGINTSPVIFPDEALETAVRVVAGVPELNDIYPDNLDWFNSLSSGSLGITDLTGLEYCTGLTYLNLSTNNISDISALSGITSLSVLYLSENNISDISDLSGLTGLSYLYLNNNNISDISVISGMSSLHTLYVQYNKIVNISPLSGHNSLVQLSLSYNNISNVPSLSGLGSLQTMICDHNNISNVSGFSGINHLLTLYASNNNINVSSVVDLAIYIRDHYVGVHLITIDLSSNNISDISAFSNIDGVERLWLSNNNIVNISGLSGLCDSSLYYLYLDNNNISNVSPLSCLRGQRWSTISLKNNDISDIEPIKDYFNRPFMETGYMDLTGNHLNSDAYTTYIPYIESLPAHYWITVYYDAEPTPTPTPTPTSTPTPIMTPSPTPSGSGSDTIDNMIDIIPIIFAAILIVIIPAALIVFGGFSTVTLIIGCLSIVIGVSLLGTLTNLIANMW